MVNVFYTCWNLCFWSRAAPMAHHQVDGAANFLGLRLVSLHAVPEKERVLVFLLLLFHSMNHWGHYGETPKHL